LQSQVNGNTSNAAAACPYTWTRTLSVGSTGSDVKKLQQFLNSDPTTAIAVSGVGSKGNETEYYGALTGAAVAKFQNKYKSEILTPIGLSNATTFFGNATKAKMNALCISAPNTNTGDTGNTGNTNTGDTITYSGNEATVSRFRVSSGDDTHLEEGQSNASVMDIEFRVEDGDITINRIDVAFNHVSGTEDRPWDTFAKVMLLVDGKEVASKVTTSKSAWTEDKPYADAYQVRFSNLSIKVDESEDAEFSVAVTLAGSIDGARAGLSWDIMIPDDGIRFTDGAKVTDTIGDQSNTVNIDIDAEGSNDELSVMQSDDDPETSTIILDADKRSGWITVFAFELDAEDSKNDIDVRKLPVSLTVSTSTVGTFVRDVRILVDGKSYKNVTITDGATNNMLFSFKSGELVVEEGETATIEVQVEFNALTATHEGTTIYGSVDSSGIVAEGADDLTAGQLSGSVTGDTHTLRTFGITTKGGDTKAEATGFDRTHGDYTIKFTVTALEEDLYVAPYATTSSDMSLGGVRFSVDGTSAFSGAVTSVLSATAKEMPNGVFLVRKGKTETFTLTVSIDPDQAGQYRVKLHDVYFTKNIDGVSGLNTHNLIPNYDYRTGYASIKN
ncbi:hypothetical protein KC722_02515, partial [Candidatus Kaiserbacteria bacterium]|nr:hypothetical protein [Candidatus Kaiserbacteria bacterium]